MTSQKGNCRPPWSREVGARVHLRSGLATGRVAEFWPVHLRGNGRATRSMERLHPGCHQDVLPRIQQQRIYYDWGYWLVRRKRQRAPKGIRIIAKSRGLWFIRGSNGAGRARECDNAGGRNRQRRTGNAGGENRAFPGAGAVDRCRADNSKKQTTGRRWRLHC